MVQICWVGYRVLLFHCHKNGSSLFDPSVMSSTTTGGHVSVSEVQVSVSKEGGEINVILTYADVGDE